MPNADINPSTATSVLNASTVQHILHPPTDLDHLPPHFVESWSEAPPLYDHDSENDDDEIDEPGPTSAGGAPPEEPTANDIENIPQPSAPSVAPTPTSFTLQVR